MSNKKETADRFLVKNNLKFIYGTNIRVRDESGEIKVKNVVLYSGWNSVKAELWDEAIKNPLVAAQVKAANIRVKKKTLAQLDEDEALEIVREIHDMRYLNIIKKTEKRSPVSVAADEQIERIKTNNLDDEEDK